MLSAIAIGYIWREACELGLVVEVVEGTLALGAGRLVRLRSVRAKPGNFNLCVF